MTFDAAEPLDRVEEPRLAADGEVEPAVAVGDDVEPRGLLGVDHARDRVEVLLAENRLAHRRLERAPVQALGEPRSEEHTSELQSRSDLVCRLLLEKKKQTVSTIVYHN